jgi:nitroimidazol reductase NimA-like FMN-containing flavoprotein (pyridoxamine 5'-phosphate oxidase superfamily)
MTAFREVRRSDRALSENQAREILARAEHGVLATLGTDGWPYAVPVNHVLSGDTLYIHCAVEGQAIHPL